LLHKRRAFLLASYLWEGKICAGKAAEKIRETVIPFFLVNENEQMASTSQNNVDDDVDLMEDAHHAAEYMSKKWIRSVFRELCYQLWKDTWKVEHIESNDNDDDNNDDQEQAENSTQQQQQQQQICRLHLTADMITQAQAKCQTVANHWCKGLQTMGHGDVADWIQYVVQQEGPVSFFVNEDEIDDENDEDYNDKTNDTMKSSSRKERAPAATEDENVASPKDQNGQRQTDDASIFTASTTHSNSGTPGKEPSLLPKATTCALTTLRQLKLPESMDGDGEEEMTLQQRQQYVIDQLDALGRSHTNNEEEEDGGVDIGNARTYWPFDWETVDQTFQAYAQRQQSTNSQSSTHHNLSNYQVQLVPKQALATTTTDTAAISNNGDGQDQSLSTEQNTADSENRGDSDENDSNNNQEEQTAAQVTQVQGTTTSSSEWTDEMLVNFRRKGPWRNSKLASTFASDPDSNDPFPGTTGHNHKRRKLTDACGSPRPAFSQGHVQIPWDKTVSEEISSPSLDRYLHPEEKHDDTKRDDDDISKDKSNESENEDENNSTPHTLLGAVKPLGHVHFAMQIPVDFPNVLEEDLPAGHIWRRYRYAQNERLGSHRIEKDERGLKVRSNVKRTLQSIVPKSNKEAKAKASEVNAVVDGDDDYYHWLDFDLGECLLDLQVRGGNDGNDVDDTDADEEQSRSKGERGVKRSVPARRLYAFSSLEVTLLDEDEVDVEGDDSAEYDESENEN